MTLTTRLCVFFLAVLACVFVGFSATFYSLARTHLYRQVDDRLEGSLNTLVAAVERGNKEVEWEPQERHVLLNPGTRGDQICWMVCDHQGNRLDGFGDVSESVVLTGHARALAGGQPVTEVVYLGGRPWRLSQRRIEGKSAATPSAGDSDQEHEIGKGRGMYPALVLTVAVSLEPVETALRNLLAALGGLSLALWLLAALAGRALCRRALVPLTRMAATARSMDAADFNQRLPSPGTGDELEDLSRAFNDLLGRLQESFERQRQFTGDASHQLRTPLTAMLGQIEVALRRNRSAEEYRDLLNLLEAQAVHLRQIVEMLLFLARADAETKLPDLEAIDLAGWLTDHLRCSWSGHCRAADLQVEGPAEGPLVVRAQAPLLGQLVDNLLDNACKYSEPGTPITLRLRGENGVVLLDVENVGRGIPADDLPHIFEPFYRSAQARRLGIRGTGLGLAVAKRVASAFGAKLTVHSGSGCHTRFTLHFGAASGRESLPCEDIPPGIDSPPEKTPAPFFTPWYGNSGGDLTGRQ